MIELIYSLNQTRYNRRLRKKGTRPEQEAGSGRDDQRQCRDWWNHRRIRGVSTPPKLDPALHNHTLQQSQALAWVLAFSAFRSK
jgi:hypothetical protein